MSLVEQYEVQAFYYRCDMMRRKATYTKADEKRFRLYFANKNNLRNTESIRISKQAREIFPWMIGLNTNYPFVQGVTR